MESNEGLRLTSRRGLLMTGLASGIGLFGLTGSGMAAPAARRLDRYRRASGPRLDGHSIEAHSLAQVRKSTTPLIREPVSLGNGLVDASSTPQVVTHAVGPLDLHAGDRVLLTAREEFSNPNTQARGAWKVDGMRSEHWSLWVMAAIGIMRGTSLNPAQGYWVRRQTAENWDNYIHHKTMDVAEWDLIDTDLSGVYYFTVCYFASSPSYRPDGAQVLIEQGDYGKLEAAVFRA